MKENESSANHTTDASHGPFLDRTPALDALLNSWFVRRAPNRENIN